MTAPLQWLFDVEGAGGTKAPDGVVRVNGVETKEWLPEEIVALEKAKYYKADAVFFEPRRDGQPAVAQAFIYHSELPEDPDFSSLHRRLWSWGGVPLVYRATPGKVQLFRCAHRPDFEKNGELRFSPFDSISTATLIAADPWWQEEQLRKGTLWDDPAVCKLLLSSNRSALKTLITEVKDLYEELVAKKILQRSLGRRLLILSILIAYLEARKVFEDHFFDQFLPGATSFFQVLADSSALIDLLEHLESRFNGHVFVLTDEERSALRTTSRLGRFANLVEGKQEPGGQRTLWERYSFADLPVEFISHVYQLFVEDESIAVYTPHFLVRLMLSEILTWDRLDQLEERDEVIVDGACGSGIFLVEAYKRLVLHWRQRNEWKRPNKLILQRLLTKRIRGVDLDEGAVELTAFSLCLAMCDALEPQEIRASVHLFPPLKEKTILTGCFFETIQKKKLKNVGIAVGNPPFKSKLTTPGSELSRDRFQLAYGDLPDKQLAYLFLYESMNLLQPGGILCMLQTYGFLYNQNSREFRKRFIGKWDVREILDFVSVRGLFKKSGKDTKVLVIVAEAKEDPPPNRRILHATFRRSGRVDAELGFDIDYYDMHWLPRVLAMNADDVWRSNLLGGGRVLDFITRLRRFRTLGKYADQMNWDHGEGFVEGASGISRPAKHIVGRRLLPSEALNKDGIDRSKITIAKEKPIEGPRTEARFTPPILLIREHMDLHNELWLDGYLTYKNKVVGFSANGASGTRELKKIAAWITTEIDVLKAYAAGVSVRLFTQKATTLSGIDIQNLPYPENFDLGLPLHEKIIVDDLVNYYREMVRLGEDSAAMCDPGTPALGRFNEIFLTRINGVYKNKLRALIHYEWPGVVCQAFAFGTAETAWGSEAGLKDRIDALLQEKHGAGLTVTRIARVYDGNFIFLIKPNRLRYWLRSIALRDSDEVLADLAEQGF